MATLIKFTAIKQGRKPVALSRRHWHNELQKKLILTMDGNH